MKRLLKCSIALNVLLLALSGYLTMRRQSFCVASSGQALPGLTEVFRWSQIEAPDYPTYIQNLRAVGCPEETIRDIITADVATFYAKNDVPPQSPSNSGFRTPTVGVTPPVFREMGARLPEQETLVSALLAQPVSDSAVSADRSQNVRLSSDSDGPLRAPAADAGRARGGVMTIGNSTNVAPSPVASSGSVGSLMQDQTQLGSIRSSVMTETSPTVVAPDERNAASRKAEGLFTVEEQRYRSLYGWAAFYAAKQEQAVQAANGAE